MENVPLEAQPNISAYEGWFGFPPRFWFMAAVAGIGAGLAASALMGLLRATQHLAWSYSAGDFLSAVQKTGAAQRIGVLFMAGVLVAVARKIFKRHTGGHAGEVAAEIWFHSGNMPFWRTLGRSCVSIIVVGLGAAVGRESAPKQMGAAISNLLSKWVNLPSAQRRVLVACGTGAGMAAVYNVPMGGAIFAAEVLLGQLTLSLALPALATSLIAVAVSWLFLPNVPTYFEPGYRFSTASLAGGLLLGIAAGLASVAWTKAIAWADSRKPSGKWLMTAPIIVLTVLGAAAVIYPQLLGNGKGVTQLAFTGQFSLPLLAILVAPRALATIACFASGTPGGLFTPTMTVGALLGGLFGELWNHAFPGEAAGAYAILGAAAVFAASAKAPLASIILTFELLHRFDSQAVPLMLVVAVATLIARHFDPRSIYSARIHAGKAVAAELKQPQVISSAWPYGEIVKRLLSLPGKPIYVVDESGALLGQITAARAVDVKKINGPLEATTADDLAAPVPTLPSTLLPDEMARRLAAAHQSELPITDNHSGRFISLFPPADGK